VKSQIPKSTESGPPPPAGTPAGRGMAGGSEASASRPGTSPALSQPAMPSVQTSVSAVISPEAINWRSRASG